MLLVFILRVAQSYSVIAFPSFTGFPFLTPFLDGKKSVNVNIEAEHPSVLLIHDKKLGLLL